MAEARMHIRTNTNEHIHRDPKSNFTLVAKQAKMNPL